MARNPNPELIDEENPEWTEEMIREARPASEMVPKVVAAHRRNRPDNRQDEQETSVDPAAVP
jgi:hypothetical protein